MSKEPDNKIEIDRDTLLTMASLLALGSSFNETMLVVEAHSYWLAKRSDPKRYPYYLKVLEHNLSKLSVQPKDWKRAGRAAGKIIKLGPHPTEGQLIKTLRQIYLSARTRT